MKVRNGSSVSVHYRGTLSDGTEFDNSKVRGQTLNFQVGSGQMIAGFDNAVVGMTIGDVKKINLKADQAYGQPDPQAVQPVPRGAFPPDFEFLVGEVVQGNGPQGPFLAKIIEEGEEEIILDFNHPLAGEELNFEIELLAVNDTELAPPADWSPSMLKSELLDIAKTKGLGVNTKSTKAQIIEALQG